MIDILLVEDNEGDAYLIQELLSMSKKDTYEVVHITRLSEAAEQVQNQNFDIICLDLGLPDSFGVDTIVNMRQIAPMVPTIVLTGNEDEQVGIQSVQAGAQDYIIKGNLSTDLLERVIRYAIERQQVQKKLQRSARFLKSTVDALAAHIAIIDETGRILEVNETWKKYAQENNGSLPLTCADANYFDACNNAVGIHASDALAFANGIKSVLQGKATIFEMEYSCPRNNTEEWYHGRVTPFPGHELKCVVIAHENVTSRKEAENALKKSESLFRKVFEILPVGLWIADEKGELINANPKGKEIWGAAPLVKLKEIGVFKAENLITSEKLGKKDWSLYKTITRGETIIDEQLEIHSFDGKKRKILNSSAPILNDEGGIEGAIVLNVDITEQKRIENALREREAQLRFIFDTTPNFVFIKNQRGEYISANRAMADFYALSQQEFMGKTDSDLSQNIYHQGLARSDFSTFDARVISEKREIIIPEEPIVDAQGNTHWFRTIKTPISLPTCPDCLLGIAIDISDQRAAELETRNSEERLRTILNNLNLRVVLLGENLQILWVNRFVAELENSPQEELIGKHCYDLWQHTFSGKTNAPPLKALKSGKVEQATINIEDGKTWRITGFPITDDDGNIINVVEVSEDITESISMEHKLKEAQKIESLGTLAGGVAHDFNNILTAILGFTDLCKARSKDKNITDDLEEVYNAGLRAKELVKQILTFSRRVDVTFAPLHLPLIVKEALKLLRSTLPTSIEIRTEISSNISNVLADPTQIHQIVMNLCTNASHAMEPDGGIMTISISEQVQPVSFFNKSPHLLPGKYVELSVSDTGCGMSKEIADSIFDPYFTTKEPGEGTGLGLAVSLGIVREVGGDIIVESEPDKGSIFRVFFPAIEEIEKTDPSETKVLHLEGQGHVLLVDDESAVLKLTSRFLESSGYTVESYSDSIEAKEAFFSSPDDYDLVLSDVTMPKMSGDRLAEIILKKRPDIPVLLMTGYSKNIDKDSAASIGIKAVLIKPVSKNVLLKTMHSLLKKPQKTLT